jgi:FAD/FMN-containing dehydrogenase
MAQYRKAHEPWVDPGEMDCQAADLTATLGTDVTLRNVQAKLGEVDQWLPVDGDENLSIGQLVEENSSGALRLGFGGWRDLILGCQFRLGSGELITGGGRTVKNVAGYDVTKFLVGQRGMFGKIVTVTTRTYKRPEGALAVRFPASDQFLGEILPTKLRPRWGILNAGELWLGWLDSAAAIEFFAKELAAHRPLEIMRHDLRGDVALRGRLWKDVGEGFCAAVPPGRILEFASAGKIADWAADAAFGRVRGSCSEKEEEAIERAARGAGGSVYFFKRGQTPRWKMDAAEREILSRLAAAFRSENQFAGS